MKVYRVHVPLDGPLDGSAMMMCGSSSLALLTAPEMQWTAANVVEMLICMWKQPSQKVLCYGGCPPLYIHFLLESCNQWLPTVSNCRLGQAPAVMTTTHWSMLLDNNGTCWDLTGNPGWSQALQFNTGLSAPRWLSVRKMFDIFKLIVVWSHYHSRNFRDTYFM